MAKRGMILDCDGTLIDSMGAWLDIDRQLAARAGHNLTMDEKAQLNSFTVPEVCQWFHEHLGLGATWEDVYGMIDDIMRDFYANKGEARPGALAFVRDLKAAGVACVVVSSTAHDLLELGLARCGMLAYMDGIVSTEDVSLSKRDPRIYQIACEKAGTQLADTWGIDDSLYAVQAMHDAGYRTIGIYGHDDTGTLAELQRAATIAIRGFEDLDTAKLLENWYQ